MANMPAPVRKCSMSEILVVYYSRKGENYMPGGLQFLEKGHTGRAAEYIQKALDADIFEIDTVEAYPASYRDCCRQAVAELKANARPALAAYPEDISGYDTLFVCYPCWADTAPMCVFSFLEHYELSGKRIIPLCTNGGSDIERSVQDIKASSPGATVLHGLSVLGHEVIDSRELIQAWAKAQI